MRNKSEPLIYALAISLKEALKLRNEISPYRPCCPPDFIVSVCSVFLNSCSLGDVMPHLFVIILFVLCSFLCNAAILCIEVVYFALNR